ncbi:MAG TPA: phage minor head protein [Variovorax sp.]
MATDLQTRGFGVKFAEAIDYLKGKLPETSLAHDDLAGPVHAKVYTVAGATKADLVRDLQGSLVSALENGTTITQFRKDFDQAVQEHGWTYKGKRGWRTSVIFDTNMRSSHMAGRWAQIQAGKARRPFLQYRTAGDARVRPQHRAWNGLIYPVDDAFWQTHYPPNGWGCRCTVRAYSQADLDDKNLSVAPPFEGKTREVITRDGEIKDRVPVGIDPGWDHNVGQSWISPELALGQKLARLPRELQGIVVDKTITPAFQTVLSDNFKTFRAGVKPSSKPRGDAQVLGFLDSAMLNGLAEKVPALKVSSTAITVVDQSLPGLTAKTGRAVGPQAGWPADWVDTLPEQLRSYQAVLWDTERKVLVVVPLGGSAKALPTVALRPNVHSKLGDAFSVVEVGMQSPGSLGADDRFKLVAGRIPEITP